MTSMHHTQVTEYDDGSAFSHCSCGWVGPAYEDHLVDEDDPPYALAKSYNDAYGHTYRTGHLGLDQ